MDLQKGKILLDKINALYGSMNSDSDNIASIEKDLMRSYVRQFYEIFTEAGKVTTPTETKYQKPATTSPVVQKVKTVVPPSPPPAPEPKYEQPRIIELSNDVQEFVSQNLETQPVTIAAPKTVLSPAPVPVPAKPMERREVVRSAPPVPVVEEQDEDVLDLFEHKKAVDLSERLSSLPVRDLRQAIGLNERILTVNELFGGNNTAFNTVMSDLNELNSFEEAKKYLAENVITKYSWTTKENKKKAKVLIKTIRRRYN